MQFRLAGKFVGDGYLHRAFVAGFGVDQLPGEAGNKMIVLIGVYVQREIFLLGHPARGGGKIREWLAVTGAGEADHHVIARLRTAFPLFVFRATFAEFVQRVVHVGIADFQFRFFGGQPFVLRHFEIRRGFHRGQKVQRLALLEIDFLHFRLQDRADFVVFKPFAVAVVEQLLAHLILNFPGKLRRYFGFRRLALAIAGQIGLLAECAGYLGKRRVHIFGR